MVYYDNDAESVASTSCRSSRSPRIQRNEEFVYIPYSYQLDQSLTQLCCEDQSTPVMLRSEKAQQRNNQSGNNSKLKRFTGIIYGYSILFFFLAIHSFMSWRDQFYHGAQDDGGPSGSKAARSGVKSSSISGSVWNNPNSPLFGIAPPVSSSYPSRAITTAEQQQQPQDPTKSEAPMLVPQAFDANGQAGYVADPAALKRARDRFAQSSSTRESSNAFWLVLGQFGSSARAGTRTARVPLTPLSVCSLGPGRGVEDEGGFKLLSEKIEIASQPSNNTGPKLLCAVYSHSKMNDLARTAALTWGHGCDGFLVFGESTIPELGFVQLEHKGEESYGNMFQKVRAIWTYIHAHYLDKYDLFHLGGDDMYVIPENLKHNLEQKRKSLKHPDDPIFMGQQVPLATKKPYVTGGPGYTMNRKALDKLLKFALPSCHVDTTAPYEDRLITECFRRIGIEPMDSREPATGEQTYHRVSPHTLYTTRGGKSLQAKNMDHWANEPHPQDASKRVGRKVALESASKHSVSFHNLFHPIFMARVHTTLYPDLCPPQDVLLAKLQSSLGSRVHSASQNQQPAIQRKRRAV